MVRVIEYPHPVLYELNKDFTDCAFDVEYLSHSDNGSEIILELDYKLSSKGLNEMLDKQEASIITRIMCYGTSNRESRIIKHLGQNMISLEKKNISGEIEVQSMIVANQAIDKYELPEFNQKYFANRSFSIRKADILALEPGFSIKLNTVLEKNMSGIVQVRGDANAKEMSVHYPETTEESAELTDYIMITLPDLDYKYYAQLMKKKHLKNGIDRFVQAAVVLPAITEGISKLRAEETDEDPITSYKGTVWADSVLKALEERGITSIDDSGKTDYELANILLGNIVSDSLSNLYQKSIEWSTLRMEDPDL